MEQLAHRYISPTCHRNQEKICKIDLAGWGQVFDVFLQLNFNSLGHGEFEYELKLMLSSILRLLLTNNIIKLRYNERGMHFYCTRSEISNLDYFKHFEKIKQKEKRSNWDSIPGPRQ